MENQTLNELEDFIKKMSEVDNYHEILTTIFEMHFKHDDKDKLFRNLNTHIAEVFKTNPKNLIDYLQHPQYTKIEELSLNATKYKASLLFVNKLKMKYGVLLRPLMAAQTNPFLINSIESNVGNGQSLHRLKLERADGKNLEGLFNSESLLSIFTVLIESLDKSLDRGIFNLNINTIDNYLNSSKIFNEHLTSLKKEYESEKNDKK
ncbi:hypothetical protein GOQ29_01120 [Clostridium sp. D2Q-14]|uniref:hypothetical protein n=1 Tax=Anaeromonas gelatinilytica TaxID=2683194 RepID=UPI00193AE317|nr:hypothetical protein [Anaeromonas gelatinilytica]MBS4534212.1 hypothetical protein [Anaeromonas gelatinilytica]